MKSLFSLFLIIMLLSCDAKSSQVVVFTHELRWADESRFPNFFLMQQVRDSIYTNTRYALMKRFNFQHVQFPESVSYNIINGFGKPKIKMPATSDENEPEIGIFSCITRATVGFAMYWKIRIIIKQNDIIIHNKEAMCELEFSDNSGYFESRRWLSPDEFIQIFDMLVHLSLDLQNGSPEKIVVGSPETIENKILDLAPDFTRKIIKVNGAWKTGGNFSGQFDTDSTNFLKFDFREGFLWEIELPSFTSVMAKLLTEITGIEIAYEQQVNRQINGTLLFSNDQKFGIKIKWIDFETRFVKSGETLALVSNPVVIELYDQKVQGGYFIYSYHEIIYETAQTTESFNIFTGMQTKNTLGIEKVHAIKGELYGIPVYAEFNESDGMIVIYSNEEILGVMMIYNCNPESTIVSNQKLSKNKRIMSYSSQNILKTSIEDENKTEWYPFFVAEDTPASFDTAMIQTLVCLFLSIGHI